MTNIRFPLLHRFAGNCNTMTEYWVSQGNKWCDFCKIFIANNPTSIRTHEFGQRHKDNVAKKLADLRKENAAKEKEKQQALKDLERIEAQARRSYKKDLADKARLEASTTTSAFETPKGASSNLPSGVSNIPSAAVSSRTGTLNEGNADGEWTFVDKVGYYFNAATGYYYDANSGLYYSELFGKWTTQEEAFKASRESRGGACSEVSAKGSAPEQNVLVVAARQPPRTGAPLVSSSELPGPVLKASQIKPIPGKGVPSSLEVGKRKRQEKTEPLSKDEATAIAAREAARKRTQEREKALLGLYQAY